MKNTISFEANSALDLLFGTGFEVDLAGLGDRGRWDERRTVRAIRHGSESNRIGIEENRREIRKKWVWKRGWASIETLIRHGLSLDVPDRASERGVLVGMGFCCVRVVKKLELKMVVYLYLSEVRFQKGKRFVFVSLRNGFLFP